MAKYIVTKFYHLWEQAEIELPTDDYEEAREMWYDRDNEDGIEWKEVERDFTDSKIEAAW